MTALERLINYRNLQQKQYDCYIITCKLNRKTHKDFVKTCTHYSRLIKELDKQIKEY